MGDPAGIGLEIALKAWMARAREQLPPFALIGDPAALKRACARLNNDAAIATISTLRETGAAFADALPVIALDLAEAETLGAPAPANARAIIEAIKQGVEFCLSGDAGALVTLPIAKAPLQAAGFGFPGHTEFIAHLTRDVRLDGPGGPLMMLACARLRVALVTIHHPLSSVAGLITRERIMHCARVLAAALRTDFAIPDPRIALAALNPHAGESGMMGREEIDILNPAAEALRAEGIAITNAMPSDTMFHPEARARYDCALCLYHDQALIPLKTIDFWGGVNITLGLPIVRTSPDHGAGFDIAGQNKANPQSFINALKAARAMADARAS
jgi:4-hydroxythreonine-4-phosphate dehydrogenase